MAETRATEPAPAAEPFPASTEAAAIRLLEDALFLRTNGERPPGAPRDDLTAETWADWDRRAEGFLRARLEAH